MATAVKQYATGNPEIDPLLIGSKWSGTVTYSFTDSAADYASNYLYANYFATLQTISPQQQQAFHYAFALIGGYTNLSFSFAGSGAADIRIAQTSHPDARTAHVADFPDNILYGRSAGEGGDIWFGTRFDYRTAVQGNYAFATLLHELGHALGLRHAHQVGLPGVTSNPLPAAHDWMGYSIMSYRSYQGGSTTSGYTNELWGYATTYMANDILALQTMYGADYTTNSTNTIYTWSPTTGAYLINGTTQFTPGDNRVFMTVWDGGGVDTYDLSNYTQALQINLAPGGYTNTGTGQRVALGVGIYSPGNIYNAYLFNNDTRSLIENANGGSANDTIIGNQGANQLEGRGGNDTLNGAAGNDTLIGGAGSDFIDGGADSDTAVYEVARSAVTVTYDTASQRFTITNATTGTDTVSNVEFFRFTDGTFTAEQMRNVDSTAPTLVSTAPADNATGVAPSANLIFTFSESVVAGAGNIVIFNSDGTVARTIAVTDTAQVSFSGSTMTVNPSTDLSASGNYYVNIASGVIRDTAGNAYAGLSGTTAFNFTIASAADTTAPTVTSLSPADDAVGVATGANLVITFNEAVQAGTGDIVILSTGGAVVRTIAITDTTQVTISGNTVTINPSADLSNATGYYVNMASGVVRDLAGNAFGGFSSATAWNFTTGGAGSGDDYAGSTATIGSVTVNGAVVSGNIETAGDTDWFRINLVAGQRYQFDLIGAGSKPLGDTYLVLRDSAGNILAFDDDSGDGLNSLLAYTALTTGVFYLEARAYDPSVTGTYTLQARFSDTTAPTLVSSNPADNATNVQPYANLVLTFSETVQAGASGNITIYNANGTVFQQIAVNDHGVVTFSGSTITINPSADLAANAGYYINIDAGAVRDLAGNAFAGITGSTALNFTTVTPTDDFSATTSTTGSVTPNGSLVSGNIETSGDLDWFQITLTAGVEYSLSLSGEDGTLSDPFLTLRDSAGASLLTNDNGPTSLNSVITFTPTTTGTYYLEARHASTGTGTYFIGARTTDTTAPTLTSANPADEASSVLASTNFVLTFSESVRAGSGNFTIFNSNGSVARTINIADTSQVTFSGSTVTINPTFDLGTGSSYYINIDSGAITDITGNAYGGLTGTTAYNFTTSGVTDDYPLSIATAGVVTVGGPATAGNIETANDGDAFRVTLTAGNAYTFTMNGTGGTGGLGDPYLELRDSTGAFITYNDDFNGLNSQITFTPTTSGTYFLYAYAYSTGTGTYTIGATTSGPDTTAPQITGFYPPDDSTNLAHGIGLYFLFNESIVAGSGNITIFNSNGTAARTISVTDTSQVSIFGSTLFVQPATQLDPGGSYYVNIAPGAVRDTAGNNFAGISNNTTYNFTITTAIDDYPFSLLTPGFVTLNGPAATGSIESVGDIDLYRVTLTAGATYTFTLNSAVGGLDDPYLELFDPNGLYLTFNDDFSGLNSQITFTATTSGTHYLAASAYSTGTGGYLLAATSSTADSTAPTFVSGIPADNATGVNFGANLVLTFSEAMTAGSGNIIIYNSNGTVARTISASDRTQVSFAGNTVTINPTDNLGAGRSYYIQMAAGVLRDINGNNFAGITTTTTYDFTTAALTGTSGNDSLLGGPAEDTINALEGEDILTGAAGDDILNGGPGNDIMDGGAGADQMTGGLGDDRYIVDSLGDTTIELAGEGVDEVVVYGDWTLGANIELLTLAAGSAGTGNASDNAITGNANANFLSGLGGNDRLIGLGGNDVLDGGIGGDEMTGGAGNDQYVVDSIGDTTIENANEGTDEVVASIDWTLAANVENLTLASPAFRGTGNSANNIIAGTNGANLLEGLAGDDRLTGFAGADTLDGGTGSDQMIGGTGDDRYYIDSLGDQVIENAGEGTDEVLVYGDWTLGANLENLTLLAGVTGVGNELNNVITGTGGDNLLYGLAGADTLNGGGGADLLDGGSGADQMFGGTGNDRYVVDSVGDAITELAGEGTDEIVAYGDWTLSANVENLTLAAGRYGLGNELGNVITGNAGDNLLYGFAGADTLNGGAGADYLDGGAGNDQMSGGTGDDRYVIDSLGDVASENAGEGVDEVLAAGDWTLGANLENLTLLAGRFGVGNELANLIVGNGGDNVLYGLGGNDTLNGAGGNDQMFGGLGDDRYVIDSLGDVASENAGEGVDEVQAFGDWVLGANLENLTLLAGLMGTGNDLANVITGNGGDNLLFGHGGDDVLSGGLGADVLNGGAGNDRMTGGLGNDRYVIDSLGDQAIENAGEGVDEVQAFGDWVLGANLENLTLLAGRMGTGNELANVITGTSGDDLLYGLAGDDTLNGGAGADLLTGGAGADLMIGGLGDDRYVIDALGDQAIENAGEGVDEVQVFGDWTLSANLENLTLLAGRYGVGNELANLITGTSGDNILYGFAGNDVLDGRGGADQMFGGVGDDRYVIDSLGDVVTEAAGEGVDEIIAYGDWTLGANIEYLTLGAGVRATGNELANALTGTSGANLLQGLAGDDRLAGLAGDDVMDGGSGNDQMFGGAGNDRYVVDSLGDDVVELAGEGAADEIIAYGDWTLNANVEYLTLGAGLRGTGNELANAITGNGGGNLLQGLAGDDRLSGLAGADTLDGGTGADQMFGGLGDDRYIVDSLGDQLFEDAGEGIDEVVASLNWTLGANFENLTLAGAALIGVGNAAANVIAGNGGDNALYGLGGDDSLAGAGGADVLDGGTGNDAMAGGAGNDRYVVDSLGDVVTELAGEGIDEIVAYGDWTLGANIEYLTLGAGVQGTGNELDNAITGAGGDNVLVGLGGNDALNGGAGADLMYGGTGNDRYYVDSLGDQAIENAGEGVDEIVAYGDWTLGANIELLTLAAGAVGTGNELANTITGNAQTNYLDGKDGSDRLTGGAGADAFVFSTALGAGNVDEITDFNVAEDVIYLAVSVFSAIGAAPLDADGFHIGSAAADAEDRIIYDSATGALYYDADGDGAGAAVQFATLAAGLALTHDNFFGYGP